MSKGTPLIPLTVVLMSMLFQATMCSKLTPLGTAFPLFLIPSRLSLVSSQRGPPSKRRSSSNTGFSAVHFPRCSMDSLSIPQHLHLDVVALGLCGLVRNDLCKMFM